MLRKKGILTFTTLRPQAPEAVQTVWPIVADCVLSSPFIPHRVRSSPFVTDALRKTGKNWQTAGCDGRHGSSEARARQRISTAGCQTNVEIEVSYRLAHTQRTPQIQRQH